MDLSPDPLSPALDSALARYAGLVRSVGRRHGFGGLDLDEVFQAVRIRLWRALQTGERIAGVEPSYVKRAAVSAAIDLIRSRRADRDVTLDGAPEDTPVLAGPAAGDPDARLRQSELEGAVNRAIESLPASRQPVVRMYLAGYSSTDIAATFGWTEAKARNLLYRGLGDLRARLEREGLTPETWT